MLENFATGFAVIVTFCMGLELQKAGKNYNGRLLFFNVLSLIAMIVFAINFPTPYLSVIRLIAVGAALLFNISDFFHLPREAGTKLHNIVEIFLMLVMVVMVISSLTT
jgi:hypothetical protein